MIVEMMMFGLVQVAEAPTIISERRVFSLPNEIAPAIAPYLLCMVEDRNSRVMGSTTGDAARAAIERLKADCRSERDQAETRAQEMLRVSSVPNSDRSRLIADALASIDHSQDHIADRLDQANSSQSRR